MVSFALACVPVYMVYATLSLGLAAVVEVMSEQTAINVSTMSVIIIEKIGRGQLASGYRPAEIGKKPKKKKQ